MADATVARLSCPRDASALVVGHEHGIEVDRCGKCGGAWYDQAELEMLEATIAKGEDERRGMIDYAERLSELHCPKCGAAMRAFNYRAYNLELDACPQEHGFWLDAGEAERVRTVMQERVRGLARSVRAEADWAAFKRSGARGGVLDRLRDLFKRP
jgi:Zn-finger nucleic acid-binding protein